MVTSETVVARLQVAGARCLQLSYIPAQVAFCLRKDATQLWGTQTPAVHWFHFVRTGDAGFRYAAADSGLQFDRAGKTKIRILMAAEVPTSECGQPKFR